MIQLPFSGWRMRVFVYSKDLFIFCFPLPHGKNCLLLIFMFHISHFLNFVSIARNSEIYTKFTTPKKSAADKKLGIQFLKIQ